MIEKGSVGKPMGNHAAPYNCYEIYTFLPL